MNEIIRLLEQELPACDYKVEPLYLEIIFKLQLVYQDFQKYYETVLSSLQDEKSYMNSVESMKVDMINELQT